MPDPSDQPATPDQAPTNPETPSTHGEAYSQLLAHAQEIHRLHGAASVLGWDQEVMMPPGGAAERAEQLALLASLAHERAVDPRVDEWLSILEQARATADDPDTATNVREWRRAYDRAVRLPEDLVRELAVHGSLAQGTWAAARKANKFRQFLPALEKSVALQRRKAECLMDDTCDEPWDALAEGFEPGMRARDLEPLFASLLPPLRAFVDELAGGPTPPDDTFVTRQLPIAEQEEVVREIAACIGFDFERGRLDRSAHPFTSAAHPGDVRLTTRFAEDNLPDALGSTVHEVGHGLYEQGLPVEHQGTPRGAAVSLGIHESQSRLWENQVMRSRGFWQWARYVLRRHCGEAVRDLSADDLFRGVNRVGPSLIRVEADEATYNQHIAVRFDLERAMINGSLEPADLPVAWAEKMQEYLGLEVPDDAHGCLQDVHWSCGLFGYFPTYTLGNLYAAQMFDAACRDLGDIEDGFSVGEFSALREWLRDHVHTHGCRFSPGELMERIRGADAPGAPLDATPLLRQLRGRLGAVYGLVSAPE